MSTRKKLKLRPLGYVLIGLSIFTTLFIITVAISSKDIHNEQEVLLQTTLTETNSTEEFQETNDVSSEEENIEYDNLTIAIENDDDTYFISLMSNGDEIKIKSEYEQTDKMQIFTIDSIDYHIPLNSTLTFNEQLYKCSENATLKTGIAGEYTASNGKDIEQTYNHGTLVIITKNFASYFDLT